MRGAPAAGSLGAARAPEARGRRHERTLPAGLRASGGAHRRDEITLAVAGLRTRMREQVDLAGVTETIGPERFFPTVSAAVEAFQAQKGTRSITRSG